jgi:type III secretion protein V
MTQAMRLLLAEEISIRNLRQILQAMIEFTFQGAAYDLLEPDIAVQRVPGDEWMSDPTNLTAYVRIKLKGYISHKYTRGDNTLVCYLLDREIEQLLANSSQASVESCLASLDQAVRDRILAALDAEIGGLSSTAQTPRVLTTSSVRPNFHRLIAPIFPRVAVLCYQELSPGMNIQPLARIGLS